MKKKVFVHSEMTLELSCCRAVGIIEGDPSIESALLKPLRLMTELQVCNAGANSGSAACC